MARGTWQIDRKIGGVWTNIGTIYRPNSNMSMKKVSTQKKVQLANGSAAFITPETKYFSQPLTFSWGYLPKTYVDQIQTYVENLYELRITDHNLSIYYGKFVNIEAVWMAGEVDKYDVNAAFEIMPDLA